jgi:protein-tyrosine phosphatase
MLIRMALLDRLPSLAFWKRASSPDDAAPQPGAVHVLMVCTGNICRSPTAQGVMRALLRRDGLQHAVWVDSAGTHGYHTEEAPDARAIRHAAARGYDLSGLKARPVSTKDFARFHWMLAMDEANLAWLQRKTPSTSGPRIELLTAAAGLPDPEVPDPYYGPDAGFEHVLDLVERACEGFLRRLEREGALPASASRAAGAGPQAMRPAESGR